MNQKLNKPTELDLLKLNNAFLKLNIRERLEFIYRLEGNKIITTSGGETTQLLPHLIKKNLGVKPTILFIDTKYYLKETYEIIEELKRKCSVKVVSTEKNYNELENLRGKNFELFKKEIKIKPFKKFIHENNIHFWITGLLRYKSEKRRKIKFFEIENKLVKINPILDMTEKEVENYFKENNLKKNNNHFDILKGKSQKLECGLHSY